MHRIVRIFMLAALALAACSSAQATRPPAGTAAGPGAEPTAVAATSAPATRAPVEAPPTTAPTQAAAEPTAAGGGATEAAPTEAAPTSEPTAAPPTEVPPTAFVISEEFTPSDPETVNLAAGQPQLVEFFAFW